MTIDSVILNDIQDTERSYVNYCITPFINLYVQARERFEETLDNQAQLENFQADICITALTLGFGAGIGAMFGKVALRSIVADRVVSIVADRNLERTFNLMHGVSSSVAGTYIVEEIWDRVAESLTDGVKTQIQGLFNIPFDNSGIPYPLILQNNMSRYAYNVQSAVYTLARNIIVNQRMSDDQKNRFIGAIRNGHFMRNKPSEVLPFEGGNERATRLMELSFYLSMILSSGRLVSETYRDSASGTHIFRRDLGPITSRTTDPAYPRSQSISSGLTQTYVGPTYPHLGRVVLNRINELYSSIFNGTDFIPNGWFDSGNTTVEAVRRAEVTLEYINRSIYPLRL